MSNIFLVSNRLPLSVERRDGVLSHSPSVGGLVSGIGKFHEQHQSTWFGWPGIASDDLSPDERKTLTSELRSAYRYEPVFLSQKDLDGFYDGFSNSTIWPLFHYFNQHAVFDGAAWDAYRQANELFRDALLPHLKPGDTVWIQDYHFLLLPQMLREAMPDLSIGFFLHIPFPSFEILRLLPWREQILEGMLGADLIGFHTYDYVLHFLKSVQRFLGIDHELGKLRVGDRELKVDAFPLGIDTDRFTKALTDPAVLAAADQLRSDLGNRRVIVSIDRLDYMKGIDGRLTAFAEYLKRSPEQRGKVTLMLVVVPSRTGVQEYMEMKEEIDRLVGKINGEYGNLDWTPVHYLYRSLRFPELVALYSIADIALITPLRDGMNLVAKEYVASRAKPTGVLILSEMAGAAKELGDAILVNPAYQENLIRAFVEAVDMPLDEQERRMRAMQLSVRRRNSTWWAEEFTSRLEEVKKDQKAYLRRLLLGSQQEEILKRFAAGPTRLLILDYDGTLVPYVRHPQQSDPGPELLTLLGALARMPNTEVVVASGRRRENLEQWFDGLPIGLIGEHGMWMRKQGGEWTATESFSTEWKNDIRPPLERYVDATPGSFLEEKDFSLAWHYRLVDPELWKARVPELLALLGTLTQKLPLQVRDGQRVIEVKSSGMDKGRAAQSWLVEAKNGFILAAGDDWTDEDLFAALPETAFSIRVGLAQTRARAFVHDWQDIVRLLKNFQTFRL